MDRTTSYTDSWYRQPAPVPYSGPAPTPDQWTLIAALWLLAAWTADGTPGWRTEFATGTTAERSEQQWRQPPPLPEITRLGGFLESGAGRPVTASVLTGEFQPAPRQPYESTRPRDEVTAELRTELSQRIPVADPRGEQLLAHLAGELVGSFTDLLRVGTGDDHLPSVATARDDLHLVQRDYRGRTLRLTVAPAPTVEQPPTIGADGAEAALRTRLACLMTLLSDLLWVNNNNPVTFRAWIGERQHEDPLAAATDWWRRTREEEPDELPKLHVVSVDELRRGMANVVRGSLLHEDWEGDGEWPEIPSDHVAGPLSQDLIDVLLARMTGPDGGPPLIAYAGFLPLNWLDEPAAEDDFDGTVLFVGAAEVAVLDVDMTC
ncbi:MAG TPA: hypothetical protein VGD43_10935 [Micromonospora sp.]